MDLVRATNRQRKCCYESEPGTTTEVSTAFTFALTVRRIDQIAVVLPSGIRATVASALMGAKAYFFPVDCLSDIT